MTAPIRPYSPPRGRVGDQTRPTDAEIDEFVGLMRGGLGIIKACEQSGINPRFYYLWMRRGQYQAAWYPRCKRIYDLTLPILDSRRGTKRLQKKNLPPPVYYPPTSAPLPEPQLGKIAAPAPEPPAEEPLFDAPDDRRFSQYIEGGDPSDPVAVHASAYAAELGSVTVPEPAAKEPGLPPPPTPSFSLGDSSSLLIQAVGVIDSLLHGIQVRMADGRLTTRMCQLCEMTGQHGTVIRVCDCVCHDARDFLAKV